MPKFMGAGYVGGQMRGAAEIAIGRTVLDQWSGRKAGDPVAYFREALGSKERLPSQSVVERVLAAAFEGESITIAAATERCGDALRDALADEGVTRPLTYGFRDILFYQDAPGDLSSAFTERPSAQRARGDFNDATADDSQAASIFVRTLGAAILDAMSGYPGGSLAEGYVANGGGRDVVAQALEKAFGADFSAAARAFSGRTGQQFRDALVSLSKANGSKIPGYLTELAAAAA